MEQPPHLGDVLRQLREEHGWSLGELSRRANVDVSTLSRIERRKHDTMTLNNLARVAQALHVSVTEIERRMGRNQEEPAPDRWPTYEEVVHRDRELTDRQKRALVEIYRSYTQQ